MFLPLPQRGTERSFSSPFEKGGARGISYLNSLDAARAAFRQAVDADSKLGPQVSVAIKRGCTHYELKCGPSDQYRFLPEQAGIEAALRSRIEPAPKLPSPS